MLSYVHLALPAKSKERDMTYTNTRKGYTIRQTNSTTYTPRTDAFLLRAVDELVLGCLAALLAVAAVRLLGGWAVWLFAGDSWLLLAVGSSLVAGCWLLAADCMLTAVLAAGGRIVEAGH